MSDDNTVLHQGSLISLHKERVEFPNGGHTYFDIVKHPGGHTLISSNPQAGHVLQRLMMKIKFVC